MKWVVTWVFHISRCKKKQKTLFVARTAGERHVEGEPVKVRNFDKRKYIICIYNTFIHDIIQTFYRHVNVKWIATLVRICRTLQHLQKFVSYAHLHQNCPPPMSPSKKNKDIFDLPRRKKHAPFVLWPGLPPGEHCRIAGVSIWGGPGRGCGLHDFLTGLLW